MKHFSKAMGNVAATAVVFACFTVGGALLAESAGGPVKPLMPPPRLQIETGMAHATPGGLKDLRQLALARINELRATLKSASDKDRLKLSEQLRTALGSYFQIDMELRVKELDEIKARVEEMDANLQKRLGSREEAVDLQLKRFLREAAGLGFFRPEEESELVSGSSLQPSALRREELPKLVWDTIGLRAQPISARKFPHHQRTPYRAGLLVEEVREDSPAGRQGIRLGDILVGIDILETTSLQVLAYIVNYPNLASREPLMFLVLRENVPKPIEGFIKLSGQGGKPEAPAQLRGSW